MSDLSNPSVGAVNAGAAYTRAILEILGERNPLRVVQATTARLDKLVSGLSSEVAARPEAPGKWSVVAVVQHLADSEIAWSWRLRLILAEERPPLTGYDQDLWAERLRYAEARIEDALELFAAARRANLRLLAGLEPEDWKRVGVHAERGEESVEHILRLYAGHDLAHLRQIERILGEA
jgi:DinB superfamily